MVRPILEYASTSWDPYTVTSIPLLEAVQRRVARFVCGDFKTTTSPSQMVAELGWEPLQTRRANAKQDNECDSTCNLCGDADETLTHFLLECKALQECRQPIVAAIESACASLCVDLGICTLGVELVKLVIDCSSVLAVHPEVKVA